MRTLLGMVACVALPWAYLACGTSEATFGNGALADGGSLPTSNPANNQKDGDETDVDCGGATAPRCGEGKTCGVDKDCDSQKCDADKKCTAPTHTDGIKNLGESDVDCGGTTKDKDGNAAPGCETGKACNDHVDCASDGCFKKDPAAEGSCALARSCSQYHGGQTCGEGDETSATKKHEDCCVALPVDGQDYKLDKYQITAGRMRAFVERVSGNVKKWVQDNRASLPDDVRQTLPEENDKYLAEAVDGPDVGGQNFGIYAALGSVIYVPNKPSGSQGCYYGDPNDGEPSAGAHTYWIPDDARAAQGEFPNAKTQTKDRLDQKALNCVIEPLLAAFCAWDGGRLETNAEFDAAWGGQKFPWGNNPEPAGFSQAGGAAQTPQNGDLELANFKFNYFRLVSTIESVTEDDYSIFVAPPGRYAKGAGSKGHMDLAGNLLEITSSIQGGENYNWTKNGSFEGHAVGDTRFQQAVLVKYGKTGGRCARK